MTSHLLTSTQKNRAGTTLTEVLMSMMILSIGVLSLASLFPIGILSSVRATQLTHAVTLKHNAANRIDLDPGLILDPDRNYNQLTGTALRYIVDPLGSTRLSVDANGDGFINRGNGNNQLDPGEDVNNNGQLDPGEDAWEMVPPFGWVDADNDRIVDQNETYVSIRYHAGYNSPTMAENLVALPDSWTELATGAPQVFLNPKKARGDQSMDLTAAELIATTNLQPGGPKVPLRIMLVDQNNGQSHSSLIYRVGGQEIEWNRPLSMAAAANIDEIRVQQQELKYTCLFTVRRESNGTASVDVVVFLRRSFNLDDERPVASPTGFVPGAQTVTVTIPQNSNITYRSGGYVLDTRNLRWYQIASVTETPGTDRVIELQQTIVEHAVPSSNAAILMPDVVQVFQLGDR